MEPAMPRSGTRFRKLGPSAAALAVAAIIGAAFTAPAQAQEYNGNRGHQMHRAHDYRHHYYQERDRDEYDRSYGQPAYVYAPPPVYYAPPPGPPVIDFVFPLRFR